MYRDDELDERECGGPIVNVCFDSSRFDKSASNATERQRVKGIFNYRLLWIWNK